MNDAEEIALPSPESFRAIESMLRPVTVPIAVRYGGKVGAHATALLFACGNYHFLVTARHAVMDANEHDAALLTPSNSMPGKMVAIPGKYLMWSDTRIDVAALPITKEFQPHFEKHQWSRLADFAATYPVAGVYCACLGVLASESEVWGEIERNPSARLQDVVFMNRVVELNEFSDGWLPTIHFAALANITGTSDHTGTSRSAPATIKGLSGSPVVLFTSNPFLGGFTPLPLRIGGFQSSVVPLNDGTGRRVTKIVHWRAMFELIASAFPTVRDIGKHYGLT